MQILVVRYPKMSVTEAELSEFKTKAHLAGLHVLDLAYSPHAPAAPTVELMHVDPVGVGVKERPWTASPNEATQTGIVPEPKTRDKYRMPKAPKRGAQRKR